MPKPRAASTKPLIAIAIAVVVVGALGGCSDEVPSASETAPADSTVTTATGTSTPTGEATPASPGPYTDDQLLAAMPTSADLPTGYEMGLVCPGDEGCPTSGAPNAHVMVRHSEHDGDWYALGVTEYPDVEAAANQVEASRDARSAENGTFDIPIEDRGDSYRPGRRGEGTLEDAEVDGWSGYRLLSGYHGVYKDGVADVPAIEGYLLLMRGATMLSAQVTVPGEDTRAVSDRLDEYARFIIDRLP